MIRSSYIKAVGGLFHLVWALSYPNPSQRRTAYNCYLELYAQQKLESHNLSPRYSPGRMMRRSEDRGWYRERSKWTDEQLEDYFHKLAPDHFGTSNRPHSVALPRQTSQTGPS
jgi:hypothetical protein